MIGEKMQPGRMTGGLVSNNKITCRWAMVLEWAEDFEGPCLTTEGRQNGLGGTMTELIDKMNSHGEIETRDPETGTEILAGTSVEETEISGEENGIVLDEILTVIGIKAEAREMVREEVVMIVIWREMIVDREEVVIRAETETANKVETDREIEIGTVTETAETEIETEISVEIANETSAEIITATVIETEIGIGIGIVMLVEKVAIETETAVSRIGTEIQTAIVILSVLFQTSSSKMPVVRRVETIDPSAFLVGHPTQKLEARLAQILYLLCPVTRKAFWARRRKQLCLKLLCPRMTEMPVCNRSHHQLMDHLQLLFHQPHQR